MGKDLRVCVRSSAKAYYVIGTEDDLLKKGVIVREGGANLLINRVGRRSFPARDLAGGRVQRRSTRESSSIACRTRRRNIRSCRGRAWTTPRYARATARQFRGPLEIAEADKFWATSKYLIIVQR